MQSLDSAALAVIDFASLQNDAGISFRKDAHRPMVIVRSKFLSLATRKGAIDSRSAPSCR